MRQLTKNELDVVSYLIFRAAAENKWDKAFLENVTIREMDDGGMGSILFTSEVYEDDRKYGGELISAAFKDADGIDVCLAVHVDNFTTLYELDVWKIDYSPLIEFPDIDKISIINKGS